jgi:hypothetical protein
MVTEEADVIVGLEDVSQVLLEDYGRGDSAPRVHLES